MREAPSEEIEDAQRGEGEDGQWGKRDVVVPRKERHAVMLPCKPTQDQIRNEVMRTNSTYHTQILSLIVLIVYKKKHRLVSN